MTPNGVSDEQRARECLEFWFSDWREDTLIYLAAEFAAVRAEATQDQREFGERCFAEGVKFANKRAGRTVLCFEPDAAAGVKRVEDAIREGK